MGGHFCSLDDIHSFVWSDLVFAWIHHNHWCFVKLLIFSEPGLCMPVPAPSSTEAWLTEAAGQFPDVSGC